MILNPVNRYLDSISHCLPLIVDNAHTYLPFSTHHQLLRVIYRFALQPFNIKLGKPLPSLDLTIVQLSTSSAPRMVNAKIMDNALASRSYHLDRAASSESQCQ